jgi:LacI family transcriptional regulator
VGLKLAKLKDIADASGYSIATVSRVLNHDHSFNVPEETRLKVIRAAERLNYVTTSRRDRSFHTDGEIDTVGKKQLRIGLAYSYSPSDEIIDPYYLSIKSAIGEHCEASGVDLKMFYLHERKYDDIKKENLDGLIALGKYSDYEISSLYELNPNFVLVDCYTNHSEIDVVMVDLKAATKELIDYLYETGVDSIGFIGGIESTIDGKIFEDTRFKIFSKHDRADHDAIYLGRLTANSGYEIMNNIIKSGNIKSAYIVATDVIAVGCLRSLNEHQIKIPEEVSIVGYHNSVLSEYTVPALSTVDLNIHHLGMAAVETMLERIKNERRLARKVFIPTELIKRKTSL